VLLFPGRCFGRKKRKPITRTGVRVVGRGSEADLGEKETNESLLIKAKASDWHVAQKVAFDKVGKVRAHLQ